MVPTLIQTLNAVLMMTALPQMTLLNTGTVFNAAVDKYCVLYLQNHVTSQLLVSLTFHLKMVVC